MNRRRGMKAALASSLALLSLLSNSCIATDDTTNCYTKKYSEKWPNCVNIACLTDKNLSDVKELCNKHIDCTGFSFSAGKTIGSSCLKKCGETEFNGYGYRTHDYWAKIVCPTASKDYLVVFPGYAGVWKPWTGVEDSSYYACGGEIRYEDKKVKGDDTAVNGIRLQYCDKDDWDKQIESTIYDGDAGDWKGMKMCSKNFYVDGAQAQVDPPLGTRDYTAMNGLKIHCREKMSTGEEWITVYSGDWGEWDHKIGDSRRYVRQARVRYEDHLEWGDDTALNGLAFQYEETPVQFAPNTIPILSTKKLTTSPTRKHTGSPTKEPTELLTENPTTTPTKMPTGSPFKHPTASPSRSATSAPTKSPTYTPSITLSTSPTKYPTATPTKGPTKLPSRVPTILPTTPPTTFPTTSPSVSPSQKGFCPKPTGKWCTHKGSVNKLATCGGQRGWWCTDDRGFSGFLPCEGQLQPVNSYWPRGYCVNTCDKPDGWCTGVGSRDTFTTCAGSVGWWCRNESGQSGFLPCEGEVRPAGSEWEYGKCETACPKMVASWCTHPNSKLEYGSCSGSTGYKCQDSEGRFGFLPCEGQPVPDGTQWPEGKCAYTPLSELTSKNLVKICNNRSCDKLSFTSKAGMDYPNLWNRIVGNDMITLIYVPKGMCVEYHKDIDYGGWWGVVGSPEEDTVLDLTDTYQNNMISSLKIRNIPEGKVRFCMRYNCNGGKGFYASVGQASLMPVGVGDNALSTIVIPKGYKVIVFEDVNFGGRSLIFGSA